MTRTTRVPAFVYRLVDRARHVPVVVAAKDRALNRRWRRDLPPSILLLRHPRKRPWFYSQFLGWLALNFPEARSQFELSLLKAHRVPEPARFRLLVPWLQDPIQQWSMEAYAQACALAARFEARGIPVINTPAALANAAKCNGSNVARGLGVRAARMMPLARSGDIERAVAELGLPVVVRADWGHTQRGILIDRREDIDESRWSAIEQPVAMEFIDTRSPDGLFRKYRYLAAGDRGVSVHVIASTEWEVRGDNKITNDSLCAEELEFITAPNPHALTFDRLRRALGLDFVAFDYAYDRAGSLVVWEANPYPSIRFGPDDAALRYRAIAVHRCFAAMTALYLSRAQLEVPDDVTALVDHATDADGRCRALTRPPPGLTVM